MEARSDLASAGSSSYASDTMKVGDGTWDATKDTFLLPNVQGLNFETMRYNGMGNRFRALDGYTSLVTAHGVLAAITFLIIVPAAILTASFYHRNARLALRVHIGLQVLTVLLTTVIFALGFFQVGPERSLTNPHHGIGLAIFLMVLVQAFGGWIIKKIEKGKVRYYIPIKLMLHQWFGRGIALLGFAQVPIGLTLYGSPASLFVVYTLWMTFLLVLYFILVHRNHKRVAMGYTDDGSYTTSGSRTDLSSRRGGPDHHRLEQAAAAVGLGAAVAALRRRSSKRRERYVDDSQVTSTIPDSHGQRGSNVTEKFTESSDLSSRTKQHTWRNRFLGTAAGAGGLTAAKSLFNRRRAKSDTYINSETSSYARPPLGGPVDQNNLYSNNMSRPPPTQTDQHYDARMMAEEEGRPLNQPNHWQTVEDRERAQEAAMSRGDMQSRLSGDSYSSYSDEKAGAQRGRWGLPGALVGFGGISEFMRRRRERKEDERVAFERRREQESESLFMGPNGQPRYTGDGTPRRSNHNGAPYVDANGSPSRNRNSRGATADPSAGIQAANTRFAGGRDPNVSSPSVVPINPIHPPPQNIPPVPPGQQPLTPQAQTNTFNNSRNPTATMAPPPPIHSSPPSTSRSSRSHPHHHRRTSSHDSTTHAFPPRGNTPHIIDPHTPLSQNPATTAASTSLLSPPAPPFAAAAAGGGRSHSRSRSPAHYQSHRPTSSRGANTASPHTDMNSPPVSVKVKMHPNGRHVTLRRLSEEEAAREREARRRGGGGTGDGGATTRSRAGDNSSPATYADTTTPPTNATSEVTDFESNRRRRRAERQREADAIAARGGGVGDGAGAGEGFGPGHGIGGGGGGGGAGGRRRTGGGTGHVEFT